MKGMGSGRMGDRWDRDGEGGDERMGDGRDGDGEDGDGGKKGMDRENGGWRRWKRWVVR